MKLDENEIDGFQSILDSALRDICRGGASSGLAALPNILGGVQTVAHFHNRIGEHRQAKQKAEKAALEEARKRLEEKRKAEQPPDGGSTE